MALPDSGNPISLSQIQTEFGGSNPISLSEYYDKGDAPSAGNPITMGEDFYGTSASYTANFLIIAGGGSGGGWTGGGGGAGGSQTASQTVESGGNLTITVGAGGAQSGGVNAGAPFYSRGRDGSNSSVASGS